MTLGKYNHYYALILAGGGGTRLWPISRKTTPKQLLPIVDDRSMLKMSVERLTPMFPADHIYIATGPEYVEKMRNDTPEIPPENYIIEPYGRNNAAATALAITVIHKRDPEAVIALLTADHYISNEKRFRELLQTAYEMAQDDYIVTLGVTPTFPSTGFGYIRQGQLIKTIEGHSSYESLGFTEKPNVVTATGFLASGEYSWNSGMFIWKTNRAIAEFERQQPGILALMQELEPTVDTPRFQVTLLSVWEKMPKISIDFAIMEGAEKMAVIPADIGWSDVGSWDSLFDILKLDKFGNGFKGGNPSEHVLLDTRNALVFSEKLTVTIGIEDLIVIDTEDALLICRKGRSQDVKDVVNHLAAVKKNEYL